MLRNFWHRQTIRTQVLVAVGVMNLCAAGIAGTVTVYDARLATQAEIDSSIELARRLVSTTLMGLSADSRDKQINELTSRLRLAHLRHVRIYVGKEAGQLVAISQQKQPLDSAEALPRAPRWFVALVAPDLPPQQLSIALASTGTGSKFIVEQPVETLSRIWPLGTVVITGEPEDEIDEVWRDVTSLAFVWLALDILVLGSLFIVLGRTLDPLARLARGMIRLEDGYYATRLPPPKVQELSAIADRFNHLAEALDRAAVENAHLYGQLIMVQEDERREVANEIHDEASPCLFGITANALSMQRLTASRSDRKTVELRGHIAEILKVTERLNQMNRMLLKKLRPVALGRVPLAELVEDLVREMERRHPEVSISVSVRTGTASFGETVDLTIYRCVQEGLTNAIRHGKACSIRVKLIERSRTYGNGAAKDTSTEVELAVVDDGNGITSTTKAGFGLTVMRERVQALGGSYSLQGARGRGTVLKLIIPIRNVALKQSKTKEKVEV